MVIQYSMAKECCSAFQSATSTFSWSAISMKRVTFAMCDWPDRSPGPGNGTVSALVTILVTLLTLIEITPKSKSTTGVDKDKQSGLVSFTIVESN